MRTRRPCFGELVQIDGSPHDWVEHANQVLQDRLVKEIRLREISSREAGNAYLPEFIEDFNRRFAVQPTSQHDAHCQLTAQDDLAHILTWQEHHTFSAILNMNFANDTSSHDRQDSHCLKAGKAEKVLRLNGFIPYSSEKNSKTWLSKAIFFGKLLSDIEEILALGLFWQGFAGDFPY